MKNLKASFVLALFVSISANASPNCRPFLMNQEEIEVLAGKGFRFMLDGGKTIHFSSVYHDQLMKQFVEWAKSVDLKKQQLGVMAEVIHAGPVDPTTGVLISKSYPNTPIVVSNVASDGMKYSTMYLNGEDVTEHIDSYMK